MRVKAFNLFLIASSIGVVIATTAIALKSQAPPGQSKKTALQQADEDFYTLVDFNAPLPADPKERGRLQARARRGDMPLQAGEDPSPYSLDKRRESGFGSPPTDQSKEIALPVSQSDAVVIGYLGDARAFLTHDKTTIFSQFTVRLEDVLKDNPLGSLRVGDFITILRGGGGVRLPSGKIIREGMHGKPLPKENRRYLLFLKYNNDEGKDYSILTAYELNAGKVSPLDGINLVGTVETEYAAYRKYDGADEDAFVREVRNLINRN